MHGSRRQLMMLCYKLLNASIKALKCTFTSRRVQRSCLLFTHLSLNQMHGSRRQLMMLCYKLLNASIKALKCTFTSRRVQRSCLLFTHLSLD